jgi:hypothetical protein
MSRNSSFAHAFACVLSLALSSSAGAAVVAVRVPNPVGHALTWAYQVKSPPQAQPKHGHFPPGRRR